MKHLAQADSSKSRLRALSPDPVLPPHLAVGPKISFSGSGRHSRNLSRDAKHPSISEIGVTQTSR